MGTTSQDEHPINNTHFCVVSVKAYPFRTTGERKMRIKMRETHVCIGHASMYVRTRSEYIIFFYSLRSKI
jgi:hypothetical protein